MAILVRITDILLDSKKKYNIAGAFKREVTSYEKFIDFVNAVVRKSRKY
jgi:hypothetical protein